MSENYDVCNLDFNEPKIAEHKSIWKNVDFSGKYSKILW